MAIGPGDAESSPGPIAIPALTIRLEEPCPLSPHWTSTRATGHPGQPLHLDEVGTRKRTRDAGFAALDERESGVAADRILDLELDPNGVGPAYVRHHDSRRYAHLAPADANAAAIHITNPP